MSLEILTAFVARTMEFVRYKNEISAGCVVEVVWLGIRAVCTSAALRTLIPLVVHEFIS